MQEDSSKYNTENLFKFHLLQDKDIMGFQCQRLNHNRDKLLNLFGLEMKWVIQLVEWDKPRNR